MIPRPHKQCSMKRIPIRIGKAVQVSCRTEKCWILQKRICGQLEITQTLKDLLPIFVDHFLCLQLFDCLIFTGSADMVLLWRRDSFNVFFGVLHHFAFLKTIVISHNVLQRHLTFRISATVSLPQTSQSLYLSVET